MFKLNLYCIDISNPSISDISAVIDRNIGVHKIHTEFIQKQNILLCIENSALKNNITMAMNVISNEIESELSLMNCMRSSRLGLILSEVSLNIKQFYDYMCSLDKISDLFALNELNISII